MIDRTGGSAFPREDYQTDMQGHDTNKGQVGMSLRDYFAAKAMAVLIADVRSFGIQDIVRDAYQAADAMLEERIK